MARLIAITYASLTIGNGQTGSDYHLTDKYRWEEDYTKASLTFEVVVKNATRSTFLTSEAALITAYTTPEADLSVTLSSSSRHVYSAALNTGFNAQPSLRKLGSDEDTGNSSRWECTVVVQLPADQSGKSGRRRTAEQVTYTQSGKRRLLLTGSYTALSSNSASAQWAAAMDTYASGVLSGLTGTWEKVSDQFTRDDTNKVLEFSRVYDEVIYAQGASTNESAIVSPRLVITRTTPTSGAALEVGNTIPLQAVQVEYDAAVDKTVSTDLASVWTGTARPLIISAVGSLTGGTVVVNAESPRFDLYENRISASMSLLVDVGGDFYQTRLEIEDSFDLGRIFYPVWSGEDYDFDAYTGIKRHTKSVTVLKVQRRLALPTSVSASADATTNAPPGPFVAGFEEITRRVSTKSFSIGYAGAEVPMVATTSEYLYFRRKA